ncbi:hypothetical protein Z965_09850 [Clostridium novyi A str. BKT29909]|uniref:ribosomal protein L7/L12 n=1 Tax=Clostridium TaxID=1485 RepID=UPI0004D65AE3|nr:MULTISPECIES: ribosomal protein L7/L12 [Clostridium]KEH85445.1 hypothetical protein Z965_09850 [Clostridium novyi A str. BKT29909]KEH91467.1 hypothetical protein Z963_09295 [Clostridium botulinum C/D str. It1]
MESGIISLVLILCIILNSNINKLQRNQEEIKLKLNSIIDYFGIDVPDKYKEKISLELKDELIKLIKADQKVKAKKKLRDVTGMGLKEAKEYVDNLDVN